MSNALWCVAGLIMGLAIPALIEYWADHFARKQHYNPHPEPVRFDGVTRESWDADSSIGDALASVTPTRKPWRLRKHELEKAARTRRAKIESFQGEL